MINDNFGTKAKLFKSKLRYGKLLPRRVSRIKNYMLLDHIVSKESNGQFTESRVKGEPRYNVRLIHEYCVKEGKSSEKLTQDELNKFRID